MEKIKPKLVKIKDRYFIEIPSEIAKALGTDMELTHTKEGIIITKTEEKMMQKPMQKPIQKAIQKPISGEEFAVLRKLNLFKFEKRTPSNVYKTLNRKEREVLKDLIEKGFVNVYKKGKYEKTGVYSIQKDIYPQLIKQKKTITGRPEEKKKESPNQVEKEGYLIIENAVEAKRLSAELKDQIKSGKIKGTRGFDGRFYIILTDFYEKNKGKIEKALKEEKKKCAKLKDISAKTKLPESACLTLLRIMDEEGEVIEKRKNMFNLV